jgi:hypothetical protein
VGDSWRDSGDAADGLGIGVQSLTAADDGAISKKLEERFDRVLIGTATLEDSLKCVKEGGSVYMKGMVGNKWSLDNLSLMDSIPSAVNLTTYDGGPHEFMATPLGEFPKQIKEGKMKIQVGQV